MSRTYVVTGASSGIGLATKKLLASKGHRVIGVDLKGSDIEEDLATSAGRSNAITKIGELADGQIDALIANAGSAASQPTTVSINFYGATEIISGCRRYLMRSKSPRVVTTSSMATLLPVDDELVRLLLEGTESASIARAAKLVANGNGAEQLIYPSSKLALSRWIRKVCLTADWVESGIPINAVAPGIVKTPMVASMIDTEAGRAALAKTVPMPLHGFLEPENVAELLIWLTSEANSHVTGQTIYIDGGSEVAIRGEDIWY